jgi:hypothetical protein
MFLGSGLAMILFTCMIGQLLKSCFALHARLHQQLLRGLHALGFECDRVLRPVAFFVPHQMLVAKLAGRQLNQ